MLKRVLLQLWLMLFVLGIGTAFALPTLDLGASEAVMVGSKGPNAARIPIYLTNSEKSTDACTGLPVDLALTAIGFNIQYDPTVLEFFKAESAPDLVGKVADANVTDPGVPNVRSANVKVVISGSVVTLPYTSTPTLIGYLYFNVKEDVVTATPVITNVINVPDQAATPGRPAQTCTPADPGQKSQRINLTTGTNCSLTVLPSNPTAGPLNVYITGGAGFSEVGIDPAGFSLAPSMYNVGNKVILTAIPEIGFRFSHWTGGCTSTANPYTLVMPAGPVDCTANFVPDVNNQSITVTTPAPASALYNSSFTVAATASSGLNVSYSSGTPAVCTNAGATFTMVSGTGSCEVRYNQAGDASWVSAPQVVNTVNAATAALAVTAVNMQTGSGFVASTSPVSPSIACPGTCIADYPYGTPVNLRAYPSWHSIVVWTGCTVAGNDCSMVMISNFSPSASFFPLLTVMRSGPTSTKYNTIQLAYDASATGDTLLAQKQTYFENLVFNQPVDIALKGGLNSSYLPAAGYTVIDGSLTISTGKVSVDTIVIK